MRNWRTAAMLLLAGCAATPPQAGVANGGNEILVHGADPGYPCRKPGDREFVGQLATSDLGARMMAEARARVLRWVPHGGMITMDFNGNRLTVRLDQSNRVVSMSCG